DFVAGIDSIIFSPQLHVLGLLHLQFMFFLCHRDKLLCAFECTVYSPQNKTKTYCLFAEPGLLSV
uniref:Uncharacterized protein n=1 Tax=Aegilops tauschii subsp. strangulata TaxID=200361 RepID=A0A453DL00_AEGTS